MQVNSFTSFSASILPLSKLHIKTQSDPSSVGKINMDTFSFSELALQALKVAQEEEETENVKRSDIILQINNDDVRSYIKITYSTLDNMKALAKLAQNEYLTADDRLKLDEDMTYIQSELATNTDGIRLTLQGYKRTQNPELFASSKVGRNMDLELTRTLLERDYKLRNMSITGGAFISNNDGTATATILESGLVNEITKDINDMPQALRDWERNITEGSSTPVEIRRLTHEEFLDKYRGISLRNVDDAKKAEDTLTLVMEKLSSIGQELDAFYDEQQASKSDASNDQIELNNKLKSILQPIDDLWRVQNLWATNEGTTVVYLMI